MTLILDLRDISAGDRSRSWRQTIGDNYLDLDIRFGANAAPTGLIAHTRVGAMAYAAITSDPQTHERTSHCMTDEVDHLFLWMQLRGRARMEQSGRSNEFGAGCFLIADANTPYHAQFLDEYQILAVKIPRLFFQGAFSSNRDFINVCIKEQQGSTIVVDYFRRMARNFGDLSLDQQVMMSAYGMRLMMDALTEVSV